jgi:Relaxase/Mobilisation nuclease domain
MPQQTFKKQTGVPLLDIVSYGRGGPRENGGRLMPAQIEQIRRTVERLPEVMVKVLSRASNNSKAIAEHIDYITRKGALELETDDGRGLSGRIGNSLVNEWDLDVDEMRPESDLRATSRRRPKLAHKLMFSMPPGTPPHKVLAAVRNFAREEFWGTHRYAFVLHTDEPHPHIHLVLKAISEQGVRVNIRKETLRHWRSEFARNLRLVGVPANATERAVRGVNQKSRRDAIYRASLRHESTHVGRQGSEFAAYHPNRPRGADPGREALRATRKQVQAGWRAVADVLRRAGHRELASQAVRTAEKIPSVMTEQELTREELLMRLEARRRKDQDRVR